MCLTSKGVCMSYDCISTYPGNLVLHITLWCIHCQTNRLAGSATDLEEGNSSTQDKFNEQQSSDV